MRFQAGYRSANKDLSDFADWFMTGVRTSKDGLTMMLIPRTDDVDTKIIKSSYSSAAGTALVTFDNVRVPAKYVMCKENEGLNVILANFIRKLTLFL